MSYRDILQRTINIISEANRYEREKMKGASAEAIASERTKRRFGRDVPGTEAARQKMHPKGEQRGGPGRKGVNTSGRTGSDPLAKREPKGNAPVTSAEAGPRKRETRRMEFLKTKVNLPEPKVKKPSTPKKKVSKKKLVKEGSMSTNRMLRKSASPKNNAPSKGKFARIQHKLFSRQARIDKRDSDNASIKRYEDEQDARHDKHAKY